MESLQTKCTPEQNKFIDELFRAEYENLFRFAYNTLVDENLADVAIQDAFLIALRKPDALCASPKPVGWIYNTMKNVIKHIERDRDYLYKKTVSWHDGIDESATYTDTYSEVHLAVCESAEWKLLTQFYIEGYSMKELAERYGISVDAIKSRLKRARVKMREKLE